MDAVELKILQSLLQEMSCFAQVICTTRHIFESRLKLFLSLILVCLVLGSC